MRYVTFCEHESWHFVSSVVMETGKTFLKGFWEWRNVSQYVKHQLRKTHYS